MFDTSGGINKRFGSSLLINEMFGIVIAFFPFLFDIIQCKLVFPSIKMAHVKIRKRYSLIFFDSFTFLKKKYSQDI